MTVGSMILTDRGERPIEDLKPGSSIITKKLGLQKLRYISFQENDLRASPVLSPVKIDCAFLGFDGPSYFSPNQRFSVRHPVFDMMFGAPEVLLRCGDLIDQPGFEQTTNLSSLTYVALGFECRQVIYCNGAALDVGPTNQRSALMCLGPEEARLALQLLEPRQPLPKRHGFPLH